VRRISPIHHFTFDVALQAPADDPATVISGLPEAVLDFTVAQAASASARSTTKSFFMEAPNPQGGKSESIRPNRVLTAFLSGKSREVLLPLL
jgi:hypothetical protein